jgi:hypothetical protein
LTVYNDGDGEELYIGGSFATAGGVSANGIARWDGSTWSALGSGVDGFGVLALKVYDDGGGDDLYAGGIFTAAGGTPANYIAKWDGSTWSALGSGVGSPVFALGVYDHSSARGLYVGGDFDEAGGTPANYIARWDGSSWGVLGSGMDSGVVALAAYDDGGGEALYAGGSFRKAGGMSSAYFAEWSCGAGSVIFSDGFESGSTSEWSTTVD